MIVTVVPDTDRPELVQLTVPRRTYHLEHFERVAETAATVLENRETVAGLEGVSEPENRELCHFTAGLELKSP